MRIGVISDTHIPRRKKALPPALWTAFSGMDLIIHAGDLVDEQVILDLETIAPVEAVAGNMDPFDLVERLGRRKVLHIGEKKIGLIHGDGYGGSTPERARKSFSEGTLDCIIFGHSHQPFCQVLDGVLMFNPGSCIDPRREPLPSYGILTVGTAINGEIFYLER